MEASANISYNSEEKIVQEIRNFVNEGLIEVKESNLYDIDQVFDELERRYAGANL